MKKSEELRIKHSQMMQVHGNYMAQIGQLENDIRIILKQILDTEEHEAQNKPPVMRAVKGPPEQHKEQITEDEMNDAADELFKDEQKVLDE